MHVHAIVRYRHQCRQFIQEEYRDYIATINNIIAITHHEVTITVAIIIITIVSPAVPAT